MLNKILQFSATSAPLLTQLSGKVVAIECNEFTTILYCIFENGEVQLTTKNPNKLIDLTITGGLLEYINVLITQRIDLHTAGDPHTAELLHQLFITLDIDWEEILSKFIGDVAAHKIGTMIIGCRKYGNNAGEKFAGMLREYLEQELQMIPTQLEVEQFMCDVDELNLRMERIQARIDLLCSSAN